MMSTRLAWERLCDQLKLTLDEPYWYDFLMKNYAEPRRKYHNVGHIAHCLHDFESVKLYAEEPVLVRAALWFHDVRYTPLAKDNEDVSAAIAFHVSHTVGGLAVEKTRKVCQLIRYTDHKQELPEEVDVYLTVDADLAILGQAEPVYTQYSRAIRQEYSMVSDELYREGRAHVLRSFLDKRSIYHSYPFRWAYEDAARENIARELQGLESSIIDINNEIL